MNTPQVIPQYVLKFVAIKNDKPVEFNFKVTIPCIQQPPLPGDEVQLPQQMASSAGFGKNTFKVESRRFLFDSIEPGTAATIYLRIS